jgi:hypothetical protein
MNLSLDGFDLSEVRRPEASLRQTLFSPLFLGSWEGHEKDSRCLGSQLLTARPNLTTTATARTTDRTTSADPENTGCVI